MQAVSPSSGLWSGFWFEVEPFISSRASSAPRAICAAGALAAGRAAVLTGPAGVGGVDRVLAAGRRASSLWSGRFGVQLVSQCGQPDRGGRWVGQLGGRSHRGRELLGQLREESWFGKQAFGTFSDPARSVPVRKCGGGEVFGDLDGTLGQGVEFVRGERADPAESPELLRLAAGVGETGVLQGERGLPGKWPHLADELSKESEIPAPTVAFLQQRRVDLNGSNRDLYRSHSPSTGAIQYRLPGGQLIGPGGQRRQIFDHDTSFRDRFRDATGCRFGGDAGCITPGRVVVRVSGVRREPLGLGRGRAGRRCPRSAGEAGVVGACRGGVLVFEEFDGEDGREGVGEGFGWPVVAVKAW